MGGITNWTAHESDFSWDGLKYFGVGAVGGAIGAGINAGMSSSLSAATSSSGHLGPVGSAFFKGFIGTSDFRTTGIAGGLLSGAVGGFSSGFVIGAGNALIEGKDVLQKGWSYGWKGAFIGGIAGGLEGGIDAAINGRNILTGAGKQQGVVVITPDGEGIFTGNEDFDYISNYDTPLVDGSNISIQGSHMEITLPKNCNGYNLGNQGLKSTAILDNRSIIINGRILKVDAFFDIGSNDVIRHLGAWRWYSNPFNSWKDLFNYRRVLQISKWF